MKGIKFLVNGKTEFYDIENASAWDNGDFKSNHCTYNEDLEAYEVDSRENIEWLVELADAEAYLKDNNITLEDADYDDIIAFVAEHKES